MHLCRTVECITSGLHLSVLYFGPPPLRGCITRKGPQRRPPRRLGRRLEEVAKAVGGGYCRLQMPLTPAFAVRGRVAGHRLALEGRRGVPPPPLPMHPAPPAPPRPGSRSSQTKPRLLHPLSLFVLPHLSPRPPPNRRGGRQPRHSALQCDWHRGGCSRRPSSGLAAGPQRPVTGGRWRCGRGCGRCGRGACGMASLRCAWSVKCRSGAHLPNPSAILRPLGGLQVQVHVHGPGLHQAMPLASGRSHVTRRSWILLSQARDAAGSYRVPGMIGAALTGGVLCAVRALCTKFLQDHTQAARSSAISLDCVCYTAIEGLSNLVWARLNVKSSLVCCKLCKLASQNRQLMLQLFTML